MTFRGWDKNASAFRDVRTRRPASPFKRVAPSLSNWLVPLFSLLALSSSLPAAMFTVVNINDSGAGSLRQALLDANSNPGADSIQFNIPGSGPHTISPETDLPAITDAVTLNGYSQPGSSPNTLQNGCNAVLRIELDGGDAMDGLVFQASDCTVRGLCLNRFSRCLLRLEEGGHVIEGNFLGTDLTGLMSFDASACGIRVQSAFNRIGGMSAEERNIISGTLSYGVQLDGPDAIFNDVQGNFIGTDRTGLAGLPNSLDGVHVGNNAAHNTIGGLDLGLPPANTIAFNGGSGVRVESGTANRILGNHLFSNGGLGIDLGPEGVTANDPADADTGANGLQNFPVLNSAVNGGDSVMIDLAFNSTPNTLHRFEFFVSADCDPSGNGEGMDLGSPFFARTDGDGNASFLISLPFTVPAGKFVSATATDLAGNTSEFSPCVQVSGPGSFRFSAVRSSANEQGGGVLITVVRTNGSAGTASVNYMTKDSTATAGVDYTPASGTLSFAEGETAMTFTVPILDDTLSDGNESVILQLSHPTDGTALTEPATALLTILDNEPAPVLKIDAVDANVVLSWTTNAPGFILHSCEAMAGAAWSALAYQIEVAGDQNTVTRPRSDSSRFYRLAKDTQIAPRLTIGLDGANLVLSWPSAAVGFVLQSHNSLAGSDRWETLGAGDEAGEQRSLLVEPAGGKKFYRLARP